MSSGSPARQAWLRLRRNVPAMGSLAVLLLIALATIAAPWIAPFDPTRQHPWLQAQPPGSSHPDVLQENRFVPGLPAESGDAIAGCRELLIGLRRQPSEEYRVALRRGEVALLRRVRGALSVEELRGDVPGWTWRARGRDGERALPPGLVLRRGEAPPPGLFAPDEQVLILVVSGPAEVAELRVGLDPAGVVTGLGGDAAPDDGGLTIPGADIVSLHGDGRELRVSHPLGTDPSGRDLLSRILHGGRISLLVGLVATAVSLAIGVVYGALSGWLGGAWDRWLMNAVDVLYGLPFMFLVILLLVNFGRDIVILFIALGAVQWLTMARIVRAQVQGLKHREFVAAARLAGASTSTILGRHLIPNCLGPVVVYTTLTVPVVILEESFLAFIGLQVEHGGKAIDSWGTLVKNGVDNLAYGWLLLWPSVAMCGTLLALNALGNGLRDALDPRLQGGGR